MQRSANDDLRLVQCGDDQSAVEHRPLQSMRVLRQSSAPWRLLVKVEKSMRPNKDGTAYTFAQVARHIGVSHERLRELIHELALELRARASYE
jgi:hypothetical protein